MIPSLSSIILGDSVSLPIKALMSAVTLLALWLLVQGALAAMKVTGAIIIIILIALVMWVMVDFGLLDVLNPTLWQWVTQPIVGIIVAVGMYWARLRYGATGVRNTSDVDDE